jgi:putative salt-induced outer membrane protein YdiY
MRSTVYDTAALALLLGALAPVASLRAQEQREPGWYDTAELTLVQTAGNTEASTFGLRNVLERLWERSRFSFTARALRAEQTTFSRFARATGTGFDLVEIGDSALTAENYLARLRYHHDVHDGLFWFTGASWERNQFAGFDSRTSAVGGVGHVWWEAEDSHFRTNYGVSWTRQEDVVGGSESFAGLELGWDYRRDFGASSSYTSLLQLDENLDDTDDLRVDFSNAVSVRMNARLALKVGLQLLYDNQPAFAAVPVLGPDDRPTGEVVPFELDELDSVLNVALVIDF